MNRRNKVLSALFILGEVTDLATTFAVKKRFHGKVIDRGPVLGLREIKIVEMNPIPLLRRSVDNNKWSSVILIKAVATAGVFTTLAFCRKFFDQEERKDKEGFTSFMLTFVNLIIWGVSIWNSSMMASLFFREKKAQERQKRQQNGR